MRVRFSPPLPHGQDGSEFGHVVAVTVDDGMRFIHASDLQGPASPVATAYLLRERPDLVYLSGPPTYLQGQVGHDVVQRGIDNLVRLVGETGCRVIVDHHAVREPRFRDRLAQAFDTGRVVTAAPSTWVDATSASRPGGPRSGPRRRGERPDTREADRRAVTPEPSQPGEEGPPCRRCRRWESRRRTSGCRGSGARSGAWPPSGGSPSSCSSTSSTGLPAEAKEMPAFEARLRDFEAADAQVVGISCDSIYSHDAWAKSLGGISYPLLADIQRDVVKRYGIHWPELNACHRATFVIDRQGVVRFVERYGRGELAGSGEDPGRGEEARLSPPSAGSGMAAAADNLGAHMSIAGGLPNAIRRGVAAGCGVVQIFVKNQLRWVGRRLDEDEALEFRRELAASGMRAACAHANYLINLATPDPDERARAVDALLDDLERAERLGLPFVVLHPGSHRGAGAEAGRARLVSRAGRGRPPHRGMARPGRPREHGRSRSRPRRAGGGARRDLRPGPPARAPGPLPGHLPPVRGRVRHPHAAAASRPCSPSSTARWGSAGWRPST